MSRSGEGWKRPCFAFVASTCVALLLVESALRVFDVPSTAAQFVSTLGFADGMFEPHPATFWRLAAGALERNERGMRGPWPSRPKQSAEYRILAVGDSCTFGVSVGLGETYASRLQWLAQLAMPGRVVKSFNGGMPGWTTHQNRRFLEESLEILKPDLVVFYCGAWNDYVPAIAAGDATIEQRMSGSRIMALLHAANAPSTEACLAAFARGEAPNGRRVELTSFRENLAWMAAASREVGAATCFVVPGHPMATRARHPELGGYREAVKEVAARSATPVVDLEGVADLLMRDGAPPQPGWVDACFIDWVHPGPVLHSALADAIARSLGWAGAPPEVGASVPPATADRRSETASTVSMEPVKGVIHAVWVGDRLTDALRTNGDRIEVKMPAVMASGVSPLFYVDDGGLHAAQSIRVSPVDFDAQARFDVGAIELSCTGRADPGQLAVVWVASARLQAPIRTEAGDLWLDMPELATRRAGVTRFDLATSGRIDAKVGAEGSFVGSVRIAKKDWDGLRPIFVQGYVVDPIRRLGALTEVVEVVAR